MNINNDWFSLEKTEPKENELEKRVVVLEEKLKMMEQKMKEMEIHHLKLTNRLLESEISKERAQNLLLRKHMSFPFTPTLLTKKFNF